MNNKPSNFIIFTQHISFFKNPNLIQMKNYFIKALILIIPATSGTSFSQTRHTSAIDMKRMHQEEEQPGDPYMPNQWNNQKLGPAYRYVTPELRNNNRAAAMPTTIFTTQVNVDAGTGQNIFGDAANEPSISRNSLDPDIMVIGWRQFDNVTSNFRQAGWAYTNDGGQTWIFPGVIEPGIFRSDPVLDYDSWGNTLYNSLTNAPTYMCKVFKSDDGGITWDTGVDAEGGDKQWMTIDRSSAGPINNIYAFWTDAYSYCIPDDFTRSIDNGLSYEPCDSVSGAPALGTLAVNRNGILYVAGVSDLTDSLIVVRSQNAQNGSQAIVWDPYVPVFMDGNLNGWNQVNPVGLYGQVNIDTDRSNGPGQDNVYLLCSVFRYSSGDPSDIMFSRSIDGGQTWSSPVRVNDDTSVTNTQWFGTMSVAPNGRIDAVWLDTRDDIWGIDESALYYSYSVDQGITWSGNEKLSDVFDPHLGYPNQDKMGDYFDMESDSLGAHLAWANTLNGEQDVYYSYIVPPLTGISEPSPLSSWSIFPNPSNGIFYLTGTGENANLEVYSTQGKLILQTEISGKHTTIDLKTKSPGFYFLKIFEDDGKIIVKKLVVK